MRHHGENSTLSNAEHHRVIELCVEQAAGRVPVIAGCGSNDTQNALLHMNFSKKSGASAPFWSRLITIVRARPV
jgi:4-hydroxy-tetrahydrodipicolinate synthase